MLKQRLHALGVGVAALTLMLSVTGVAAAESHKVNKGDTLWSISRKYKVSVNDIKRVNKLSADKPLKIGVKLTIPSSKKDRKVVKNDNVKSDKKNAAGVKEKDVRRFGPRAVRKFEEKDKTASSQAANESQVVRTALAYRGARYVRGGVGSRGFDCSGFTRHVYAQHGIKLPHCSRTQASCGKSVERKDLQPGDLVFFATRSRGISHVGLYIGNNKFIHASTPRTGVIISSMSQSYYASRYRGARRIASKK